MDRELQSNDSLITIVMNSVEKGGAERSILALAARLVQQGVNVELVLLHDGKKEYALSSELQRRVVRLSAETWLKAAVALYRHLGKRRPNFVYALMPQANIASVVACTLRRITLFTSERTSPVSFYSSTAKLWIALMPHYFSERPIFISQHAVREGLPKGRLGDWLRNRAAVLHNPVLQSLPLEMALQNRRQKCQRLRDWIAEYPDNVEEPLQLLIVSRLVPGKGIVEFLESTSSSLRGGQLRVTLAGDGALAPAIKSFLDEHGLAAHVYMAGFVDDVTTAFDAADVVLLPSRSEGFGRVGFEAYLSGCLILGLPRNSFCDELVSYHPAWQTVSDFTDILGGIRALGQASIPPNGSDIEQLAEALSVERHAVRFLQLTSRAAIGRAQTLEQEW